MNYNMQGITETIPKALHDAEISEGRNQEKTSNVDGWQDHLFQVKGQGKERELQGEWQASCHSLEEAQSKTQAWDWVLLLQKKWSLEVELS